MYELKKMERYLRVNLLGPGPRLIKDNLPGRGLTKIEKHWTGLHGDTLQNTAVFTHLVAYIISDEFSSCLTVRKVNCWCKQFGKCRNCKEGPRWCTWLVVGCTWCAAQNA